MTAKQIDADIFKAYDIRGIVDVSLTKDSAELIDRRSEEHTSELQSLV